MNLNLKRDFDDLDVKMTPKAWSWVVTLIFVPSGLVVLGSLVV